MTGTILALVCIIVSIVWAIVNKEFRSASLWALWAIFVVLFLGAHLAIPL
jgi:hypothetical protein